jgi:hypothetical protein
MFFREHALPVSSQTAGSALYSAAAVAHSPHPLPAFSPDPLRADRAQRASKLPDR